MTPISQFSAGLVTYLLDAAVRSLAFALAAGLVLVALRIRAVPARLAAWKAVLYAALAMPVLVVFLPSVRIPLPGPLAGRAPALITNFRTELTPASAALDFRGAHQTRNTVVAINPSLTESDGKAHLDWTALAAGVYLFVAALLLAHFGLGAVLSERLLRRAEPIRDPQALATLAREATATNLPSPPRLASSESVVVPVTVGFLHPAILLPAGWRGWDEPRLRAVLAHELSHVARRDPLTQALATVHRSVYWFSPLGWWLERRLGELAEQASDEAALRAVPEPTLYAEVLLGFMRSIENGPGRIRWQGAAMARGSRSRRRIERILSAGSLATGQLQKATVAGLALLAAPTLYLAAAIQPGISGQAPTAPSPPAAPEAAAPSEPPSPPATAPAPKRPVAPVKPIHPLARPVAPSAVQAVPVAPSRPSVYTVVSNGPEGPSRLAILSGESSTATFSDDSGDENDEENFVIVSGDSSTMSGSSQDLAHAKALREKIKGDFIWFRRDGKSYVVRDEATVSEAKEFFAPQEELGAKQAQLGKKQSELGAKQAALGKKQAEVSVEVPDVSADLKKVEKELSALSNPVTQEDLAQLQSKLAEVQAKLAALQGKAGEQQAGLGRQQAELGARQAELGRQQAELGREQARAAREAIRNMKKLLDAALSSGRAEPEPR